MNIKNCKVLVPVYRELNTKEKSVIAHNLSVLQDRPAALIGPVGKTSVVTELQLELAAGSGLEVSTVLLEDRYFQSVSGYNSLLMSRFFYEMFAGFEYILICQHDALVLNNTLDPWIRSGYAFVGAPNFVGFANPAAPLRFGKSMNGGLSLRRVPDVLNVIDSAALKDRGAALRFMEKSGALLVRNAIFSRHLKTVVPVRKDLNEDIFWSEIAPKWFNWYQVPPPEEAARFAFEVCPDHLFKMTDHQLPFGCHAFEKYDPEFWRTHLPAKLIPLI